MMVHMGPHGCSPCLDGAQLHGGNFPEGFQAGPVHLEAAIDDVVFGYVPLASARGTEAA